MKNKFLLGVLYCLGAVLSWGGMFPVMGSALKVMNPFAFTAIRYTIAGLLFFCFLLYKEGKASLNLEGRWLPVWILGSLGFAGFGFLVFLGQKMAGESGAVCASVMMAMMPLLSILINWLFRNIKPLKWSPFFILMSFTGAMFVVTKGRFDSLLVLGDHVTADTLLILGALCWVIYTIGGSFFPKWSPVRYTSLTTALGVPTIWTVNIILYAVGYQSVPSMEIVTSILPQIAYMVLVAGFAGVLWWNMGNKILTPINGVLFMDIVPTTTFVISAVRGYKFSGFELLGVSLTIMALVFNNIYQRFATPKPAAPVVQAPVVAAAAGDQRAVGS